MYSDAQYVIIPPNNELSGISCKINGITSFVPLDPANTDYQNIMALVDEGKLVIQPAEDPTK